jgi:hypothetical protein
LIERVNELLDTLSKAMFSPQEDTQSILSGELRKGERKLRRNNVETNGPIYYGAKPASLSLRLARQVQALECAALPLVETPCFAAWTMDMSRQTKGQSLACIPLRCTAPSN